MGLLLLASTAGCSGSVVVDDPPDDASGSSSGSSSTGGNPSGEWTTLIDGTWELPPGSEGYWCTVKTIPVDTYVTGFRALSPSGTHHTLLLHAAENSTDGEFACGPTLGPDMLHASGVGTDDLLFPDGVAVKVAAGTKLYLNLHLFNSSATTLKGTSGTQVLTVPAEQVKQTAEMILPGATGIAVPPNGTQTVEGTCGFGGTSTIFTVWPHMHQYGTHMKIDYEGAGGTKVLHDGPFAFGDQKNYVIDPVTVAAGEQIRIQCTYENPTTETIYWGDSSKSEMCFAGIYRYPALGTGCQN